MPFRIKYILSRITNLKINFSNIIKKMCAETKLIQEHHGMSNIGNSLMSENYTYYQNLKYPN